MTTEASDYVKQLPIGQEIPFDANGIPGWEIFPFEGDLRVKKLEPPVLPEPPRNGAPGGTPCDPCSWQDSDYIWTDENWRLRTFPEASIPALVMLEPREHHDLADLPAERAAELGALFQRVERAVLSLGGIERVHVARYGDGGDHLHWWFSARPEGMLQMRGSCLLIWEDVLPKVEAERWAETNRKIAAAMVADGGTAHV
jgi:diadenosine tetraphosphate (Ap4A) HIT family hydrolase